MKKILILLFSLLVFSFSFSSTINFEKVVNTSLGGYTNTKEQRFIKTEKGNDKYYKVHVNIDSNLFQTNSRFNIDAHKFFKYISNNYELSQDERIALIFHDTLIDKYGNADDYEVAEITFKTNELKKINWDNFLHIKIPNTASHYWVHPAINKK